MWFPHALIVKVSFIELIFNKKYILFFAELYWVQIGGKYERINDTGWIKLAHGSPVVSSSGHGNKFRGSIRGIELTDQLSGCQFLKKDYD
jgi:hypothetical protein